MKISMNDDVRITLTQRGADILNEWIKKLLADPHVTFTTYKAEYKDGDTFMESLWHIMNIFGGDKCYMGADTTFYDLELVES